MLTFKKMLTDEILLSKPLEMPSRCSDHGRSCDCDENKPGVHNLSTHGLSSDPEEKGGSVSRLCV